MVISSFFVIDITCIYFLINYVMSILKGQKDYFSHYQ